MYMENQTPVQSQPVQQVSPQPTPVIPAEKPKSNFLPIVFVALVCAVAFGAGGYFLGRQSQSTDIASGLNQRTDQIESPATGDEMEKPPESEELQTYTDEEFGISFQYPTGYVLLNDTEGGYNVYLFSSPEQQQTFEKCLTDQLPECNVYNIGIRYILHEKDPGQTIEQFYTQTSGGGDLNSATKLTIDGKSALVFEAEGVGLIHTTYIDLGSEALELFGNALIDADQHMGVYREIVKSVTIN